MQGTWVQSLVWEDSSCCTKPISHNYWTYMPRAHALQQEKSLQWEACTPQLESNPQSLQLENACTPQQRPSSVQSLSRVWLFVTPWIATRQASLSITNSGSLPKLICIESVMPSSHLILYRPLLLLPPIPPSIRAFSNESTLCMRWPKYWSFSFSISPSN